MDGAGDRRLAVESRAGSANLAETQAFQDDEKRILVFSDAGGTGRSYHADLGARNRRLRVHYLLEAGWKADTAIQGLGRTNRTNQAQPPLFRPIATDVKAEKRFLSTIARRLDTLGAITKGQRQTGGQGLFRPEDNLESVYARAALRQLYTLLYAGKVEGCSLQRFEDATGLTLTDRDGTLKEELPPISQFLNRLLALTIDLQNTLFAAFEALLEAKIEGAIASGTYDVGVETIAAASLRIVERRTIYTHPGTGAATQVFTIARRDRNEPLPLADALEQGAKRGCRLLLNGKSHRAAVQVPAPSLMLDDGTRRAPRPARPAPGAPVDRRRCAGGDRVAADRPGGVRGRLGGRAGPAPRVPGEHAARRHRPAAADLAPAAQRRRPCLPAADRRACPELAKAASGASASSAARSRRPGSQRPARRRRSSRPRTPSRA